MITCTLCLSMRICPWPIQWPKNITSEQQNSHFSFFTYNLCCLSLANTFSKCSTWASMFSVSNGYNPLDITPFYYWCFFFPFIFSFMHMSKTIVSNAWKDEYIKKKKNAWQDEIHIFFYFSKVSLDSKNILNNTILLDAFRLGFIYV